MPKQCTLCSGTGRRPYGKCPGCTGTGRRRTKDEDREALREAMRLSRDEARRRKQRRMG